MELFNEDRGQFCEIKRVLEVDDSNGHTTL